MNAAIRIWQQIFAILALVTFLLKFSSLKCFKIVFLLWRRDPVVELQCLTPLRVVLLSCNSVSADRIVVAAIVIC